jgi:hypothetical protein
MKKRSVSSRKIAVSSAVTSAIDPVTVGKSRGEQFTMPVPTHRTVSALVFRHKPISLKQRKETPHLLPLLPRTK